MARITRAAISNIAQLLLLSILVPIVIFIFKLIFSGAAGALAMELADQVPFFNMWLSLLEKFAHAAVPTAYPGTDLISDFLKTIIMAIFIKICVMVHEKAKFYGLPILATAVGVVVGMILISIISALFGGLVALLVYGGVAVIMLVGLWLLVSSVFSSLQFSFPLITYHTVLNAIGAVTASGYMAIMLVILGGYVSDLRIAISGILIGTGLMILSSVLLYIDSQMEDQEENKRKELLKRLK